MSKLPWMKFFPADYLLDTQPLTLTTRGVWMDMICLLWRSVSRGTLTYSCAHWTRLLRCTDSEFSLACNELQNYNIGTIVTNGNGDVTVESRRMTREENDRSNTRMRVLKHRRNIACNGSGNAVVLRRSQNQKSESEVRSQIQEKTLAPWQERVTAFWNGYPKKKGKGNVEKWFKQHQPSEILLAAMLAKVELLKTSNEWQERNGKYIPHPYSWLNAKGWEDEPAMPARKERLPL